MKTTTKAKRVWIRGLLIMTFFSVVFVLLQPRSAWAAQLTEHRLEPGDTYSVMEKKSSKKYGHVEVIIDKPGTYTLTGSPNASDTVKNTTVRIDPPKNSNITVFIDNVRLSPSTGDDVSAIVIGDGGGTVRLISKNEHNHFVGRGQYPAIRKDNTNTKLIFDSDGTGVITAYADEHAFRVCAIGCHSPNIAFLSRVWAKGDGKHLL